MREDRPSTTAQRVAIRRAAHQLLDDPPVFADPLALAIIGQEAAARLTADPQRSDGFSSRFLRAFIAARSRYAEDQLSWAVERGTRQYVVLGAGLDTFACRNPHAGLRVFEVDHPATQAWKQQRLQETGIDLPNSLTFAPVDFERQTLREGLVRAGFDAEQPSFFSWLGVTPYLERETVLATLRVIASLSGQSGVAFDYAIPRSSLDLLGRMVLDALGRRVAAAGEPFQGFFEPSEMVEELRRMGFRSIEDLDGDAINTRYFSNRTDGLRVGGKLARLACART